MKPLKTFSITPTHYLALLLFFLISIPVAPPCFSQYIEINRTDGTQLKLLTSTIDSIKLVSTTAGTVTDIDGNVYSTITIGTQVWMKENLKVTKYRNGDAIATTTSTSIPNDSTSKYQWAYNNDNNNAATYGRLYTWYAITDSRNVC